MRPRLAVAVTLAVVALATIASPADFDEIQKRGTLRVLVVLVDREPEFFTLAPGQAPGFDHEVLDGYARAHKLRLAVVPIPSWDGLIPALIAGRGDVIAGRFTVTSSRRAQIDFSDEVFPSGNVVVTRAPRPAVTSLEQLRRERVGTVKGTSLEEAVAQAGVPPSQVDSGIPPGGLPEALASGRVTAALFELEGAITETRRDPAYQLGMFVGRGSSFAYGVAKGNPRLLQTLNDHITLLRRTRTWERLVVKYFGDAAPEILRRARTN